MEFPVLIKDIPPTMSAEYMGNFLARAGGVLNVVVRDCVAYVYFDSEISANNAIKMFNFYKFDGVPIRMMKNDYATNRLISEKVGVLIVNNIDSAVQLSELYGFFSQIGEVISCQLMPTDWGSFGIALIQYRDPKNAVRAKNEYNGYLVNGKPISIEIYSTGEPVIPISQPSFNMFVPSPVNPGFPEIMDPAIRMEMEKQTYLENQILLEQQRIYEQQQQQMIFEQQKMHEQQMLYEQQMHQQQMMEKMQQQQQYQMMIGSPPIDHPMYNMPSYSPQMPVYQGHPQIQMQEQPRPIYKNTSTPAPTLTPPKAKQEPASKETGVLIKRLPDEFRDPDAFHNLISKLGESTGCSMLEEGGLAIGIANFIDNKTATQAIAKLANDFHLEAGLSQMASEYIIKQGESRRRTLFISNLSDSVDDYLLKTFVSKYGTVESCGVKKNPETGKSKCIGYVCFTDVRAADACKRLSGKRELAGKYPYFSIFKGPLPK